MLERAPTLQMEVAKLRPILWLGLCNTRRLRLHLRGAPEPKLSSLPRSRSEEHTSELQSRLHLVCRLLLEKKKKKNNKKNPKIKRKLKINKITNAHLTH